LVVVGVVAKTTGDFRPGTVSGVGGRCADERLGVFCCVVAAGVESLDDGVNELLGVARFDDVDEEEVSTVKDGSFFFTLSAAFGPVETGVLLAAAAA